VSVGPCGLSAGRRFAETNLGLPSGFNKLPSRSGLRKVTWGVQFHSYFLLDQQRRKYHCQALDLPIELPSCHTNRCMRCISPMEVLAFAALLTLLKGGVAQSTTKIWGRSQCRRLRVDPPSRQVRASTPPLLVTHICNAKIPRLCCVVAQSPKKPAKKHDSIRLVTELHPAATS